MKSKKSKSKERRRQEALPSLEETALRLQKTLAKSEKPSEERRKRLLHVALDVLSKALDPKKKPQEPQYEMGLGEFAHMSILNTRPPEPPRPESLVPSSEPLPKSTLKPVESSDKKAEASAPTKKHPRDGEVAEKWEPGKPVRIWKLGD